MFLRSVTNPRGNVGIGATLKIHVIYTDSNCVSNCILKPVSGHVLNWKRTKAIHENAEPSCFEANFASKIYKLNPMLIFVGDSMDGNKKIVAVIALTAIILAFVPPAFAQMQSTMPMEKSNKDMMSTIAKTKDLRMAASMMKSAGVDKMMTRGKHTLFVPSDAAMKRMGTDRINMMNKDKQMAMNAAQGLAVNGMVMPSDLTNGKTLTMMNGQQTTLKMVNGQMMIGGAGIKKAIQTTNGMIYIVDNVPSMMMSMGTMNR